MKIDAYINTKQVKNLHTELTAIKCPICGKVMEIFKVEPYFEECEYMSKVERTYTEMYVSSDCNKSKARIKLCCLNCAAELSLEILQIVYQNTYHLKRGDGYVKMTEDDMKELDPLNKRY